MFGLLVYIFKPAYTCTCINSPNLYMFNCQEDENMHRHASMHYQGKSFANLHDHGAFPARTCHNSVYYTFTTD